MRSVVIHYRYKENINKGFVDVTRREISEKQKETKIRGIERNEFCFGSR